MIASKTFLTTLLGALLLLLPGSLSSCEVDLQNDDDPCIQACAAHHSSTTYVCDQTVPWLHHKEGTDSWLDATPPAGTGPHTYSVFEGTAPCSSTGSCSGCASPSDDRLCLVVIDADNDCDITCGDIDNE